jgi:hypothetical protein
MEFKQEPISVEEAINTLPEKDLVFIATYNPLAFKQMCVMLSLEQQLNREGKSVYNPVILEARKNENWFVRLRRKLQEWLFSQLLKMALPKP